jgi:hypothetical protein
MHLEKNQVFLYNLVYQLEYVLSSILANYQLN